MEKFLTDLKNNPSIIHKNIEELTKIYNLSPEQKAKVQELQAGCQQLTGVKLKEKIEERINTVSPP